MPRDRTDDYEDDDRPPSRRRPRDDDDEDERPRRRLSRSDNHGDDGPPPAGSNGLATTSLVFGVLSFCTGITFLPGLICGFMGLAKAKKSGTGKGVALAGILTSLGGFFVTAAVGVGGYFFYLEADKTKERIRTQNNFKMVGIGAHAYHDANDRFSKPYLDESERGVQQPPPESELKNKLSWRVAILPYLEYDLLYRRFVKSESWDSPTNKPLSQTVVRPYADYDAPLDPTARIRCFYGNGTMFDLNQKVTMMSVSDGTSNTILYVEGGEKVTWSQFNEYKFDPNGNLPVLGHPKRDYFIVGMADGSVRQVRKSISPATLKAAITRSGGEVLGADW